MALVSATSGSGDFGYVAARGSNSCCCMGTFGHTTGDANDRPLSPGFLVTLLRGARLSQPTPTDRTRLRIHPLQLSTDGATRTQQGTGNCNPHGCGTARSSSCSGRGFIYIVMAPRSAIISPPTTLPCHIKFLWRTRREKKTRSRKDRVSAHVSAARHMPRNNDHSHILPSLQLRPKNKLVWSRQHIKYHPAPLLSLIY